MGESYCACLRLWRLWGGACPRDRNGVVSTGGIAGHRQRAAVAGFLSGLKPQPHRRRSPRRYRATGGRRGDSPFLVTQSAPRQGAVAAVADEQIQVMLLAHRHGAKRHIARQRDDARRRWRRRWRRRRRR